jgi:hypothetical protein
MQAEEFYTWLTEESSPFVDCMFSLCDLEANWETIEFPEWFYFVCIIAVLTEEEVLKLLFFWYDHDKNGFIERHELFNMTEQLHGTVGGDLKNALEVVKVDEDGRIGFKELILANKEFPHLLFPIFRTQANVWRHTFTDSFWIHQRVVIGESQWSEATKPCRNTIRHIHDWKARNYRAMRFHPAVGKSGSLWHFAFGNMFKVPEQRVPMQQGAGFISVEGTDLTGLIMSAGGKVGGQDSDLKKQQDETQDENDGRRERRAERGKKRLEVNVSRIAIAMGLVSLVLVIVVLLLYCLWECFAVYHSLCIMHNASLHCTTPLYHSPCTTHQGQRKKAGGNSGTAETTDGPDQALLLKDGASAGRKRKKKGGVKTSKVVADDGDVADGPKAMLDGPNKIQLAPLT